MAIHVSLFLFSKPAHELDCEGEEIDPGKVKALAEELHHRLSETADYLEKMTSNGWEATMMLYDVCLSHPYINTEAEARNRIEDLGLDPERFCFMEFDDEEEWDEDDEEFAGDEFGDDEEDNEFGGSLFDEGDGEAKEP